MEHYFNKLIEAFKYHKLLLFSSYLVANLGIRITPFYLTQEFPEVDPPDYKFLNTRSISYHLLTPSDIEKLLTHPEFRANQEEQKRFTQDNCLCYALIQDDEIMSVMWCNLRRCHSLLSTFPINNNEAYLFGAQTFSKYKGLNLAPYLRSQVYQSLSEMGRSKLYSLTEYFNTPSKNFKKKLKAKHLKLKLYLKLFYIFEKEFTLRNYCKKPQKI